MKLGIDVGRVLIAPGNPQAPDTSFIGGTLADALNTPPYEGMFDVVPKLVQRFDSLVWIVSKCGPRVQERTRQWFERHRLFECTGIPRSNVRFCLKRPEKALHCRELGITHFIDDRTDVLEPMLGIVPHLYLFGPQRGPEKSDSRFVHVASWQEVAEQLL